MAFTPAQQQSQQAAADARANSMASAEDRARVGAQVFEDGGVYDDDGTQRSLERATGLVQLLLAGERLIAGSSIEGWASLVGQGGYLPIAGSSARPGVSALGGRTCPVFDGADDHLVDETAWTGARNASAFFGMLVIETGASLGGGAGWPSAYTPILDVDESAFALFLDDDGLRCAIAANGGLTTYVTPAIELAPATLYGIEYELCAGVLRLRVGEGAYPTVFSEVSIAAPLGLDDTIGSAVSVGADYNTTSFFEGIVALWLHTRGVVHEERELRQMRRECVRLFETCAAWSG